MTDQVGGRRVTSADVARSLGVSRATVGFVLNDTPGARISTGTRERVLAEAARLGYRPHTAAQALARGTSRIVLFVLPEWPVDHRMRRYLAEVELELDRAGYSMVTYTRHPDGRARPLWEVLEPDVVVGFTAFDAETLAAIRGCGITRVLPGEAADETAGVTGGLHHPEDGPRLQVDHLLDRGHRRLGIAAPSDPRLAGLSAARVGAARRRAHELGLTEPVVVPVAVQDGGGPAARDAVATWRRHEVTAVVAYNDDVAAAVVGAALREGLAVPGDLAVVGHDDTPLARLFVPALTSVDVDMRGVGRSVARLILQAAREGAGSARPQDIDRAGGRVVVRETT